MRILVGSGIVGPARCSCDLGGHVGARKLVTVERSGLGAELRHIRDGCGMTLDVVCDKLGWPLSKLSRMETADYARAVAKSGDLLPEQIEPWVEDRLARRFILTKDKPVKFDMILGEGALRQMRGSRKIMARQLHAIMDAADRPNVRLWVVPF